MTLEKEKSGNTNETMSQSVKNISMLSFDQKKQNSGVPYRAKSVQQLTYRNQ